MPTGWGFGVPLTINSPLGCSYCRCSFHIRTCLTLNRVGLLAPCWPLLQTRRHQLTPALQAPVESKDWLLVRYFVSFEAEQGRQKCIYQHDMSHHGTSFHFLAYTNYASKL